MSNQELQTRYDLLVEKVRRMRGAQREYFKYRAKTDLEASKKYEREVDRLIQEEVDRMKSNQKELF